MKKRSPLYDSINSLLVFYEVARQKSFSRAAEALFISQPAVTKHIRGLENKVGWGLIQRGKGGFKKPRESPLRTKSIKTNIRRELS